MGAYIYVYKAGTEDEVTRNHALEKGKARYELAAGDYDIRVRAAGISAPDRLLEGIAVSNGETTERSVDRSEEHTSELQSLMRISYAVFCLKKKTFTE